MAQPSIFADFGADAFFRGAKFADDVSFRLVRIGDIGDFREVDPKVLSNAAIFIDYENSPVDPPILCPEGWRLGRSGEFRGEALYGFARLGEAEMVARIPMERLGGADRVDKMSDPGELKEARVAAELDDLYELAGRLRSCRSGAPTPAESLRALLRDNRALAPEEFVRVIAERVD